MMQNRTTRQCCAVLILAAAYFQYEKTEAAMETEYRQLGGTNPPVSTAAQSNEVQALKRMGPKNSSESLKRKVEGMIIPEVNVRAASVGDVIDFLKEQTLALSGDKVPINLVWDAPEAAKLVKVTLNLRDVPLAEALKYVTESAGLHYRIDAHAIVIYGPPPATPPHAKP